MSDPRAVKTNGEGQSSAYHINLTKALPAESRVVLPWPPSVNMLYANSPRKGRPRVRSENYRRWQKEAGWTLISQHPRKYDVPVRVSIELVPPNGRGFDLDNRAKAVLDLLVTHGILRDDNVRWVRSVSVTYAELGAPCTVVLEPVE